MLQSLLKIETFFITTMTTLELRERNCWIRVRKKEYLIKTPYFALWDAVVDTVTGPSTQVTTNYIGTTGEPMAWITQQNSTDLKELQSRGAMEPKIGSVWFRSRKRLSPPLLFALRVACERPGRSRALLAKIACWRGQRRGTRVDVDSSGSCRVRVGFMPSFVILPGGKL